MLWNIIFISWRRIYSCVSEIESMKFHDDRKPLLPVLCTAEEQPTEIFSSAPELPEPKGKISFTYRLFIPLLRNLLYLQVSFMHVMVEEHSSMTQTAALPCSRGGTVRMETWGAESRAWGKAQSPGGCGSTTLTEGGKELQLHSLVFWFNRTEQTQHWLISSKIKDCKEWQSRSKAAS